MIFSQLEQLKKKTNFHWPKMETAKTETNWWKNWGSLDWLFGGLMSRIRWIFVTNYLLFKWANWEKKICFGPVRNLGFSKLRKIEKRNWWKHLMNSLQKMWNLVNAQDLPNVRLLKWEFVNLLIILLFVSQTAMELKLVFDMSMCQEI